MEHKPLFSLIMCIFGVEDYVFDAISALLRQDCSDFELLVIDDAAWDRSLLRALRAIEGDRRVRVIHNKKNKGLAASRNIGIEAARGSYIAFPDAEDIAEKNYLSLAEHAIKKSAPDIIVEGIAEDFFNRRGDVSYSKEHGLTLSLQETSQEAKAHTVFQKDIPALVLSLEKEQLMRHIYTKFFKRTLISDMRFETKRHYSEDFFFTLEAFARSQSVCIIPTIAYRYKRHLRRQKQLSLTDGTFIERHRRIASLQLHQEEHGLDTLSSRQFLGSVYMRYIMAELGRMENPAQEIKKAERQKWFAHLHEDPLFMLLVKETPPDRGFVTHLYRKALLSRHPVRALQLARLVAFLKSFGPEEYSRTQD